MVHGYFYCPVSNYLKFPPGSDTTMYALWGRGAGAIVSTAEDLEKWVLALYTPGKVLNKKQYQKLLELVSPKTGQALTYPIAKKDSGFGLGISYVYIPKINRQVYYYKGQTFGSRGFYIYDPKNQIIITATLNSCVPDEEDHIIELITV